MRKPTIWASTKSDTNQAVQSQKMARGGKFWILDYPCSESKGADQLRSYYEADLRMFFAYADRWFFPAAAHFFIFKECFLRTR